MLEPDPAEPVNESVRVLPAVALRNHVAWYSGYRQEGVEPARHRGLPSPYLTLIITLDDPLTVAAHPDPRQGPEEYETLVGGLHTTPALITHQGRQSGIQVGLLPIGARALLGMPAGELASLDLHAGEVLGRVAAEVQERVRVAGGWAERFAIIDQVLLRRLAPARAAPPAVLLAWRMMLASGGSVTVGQLAREVGGAAATSNNGFGRRSG